MPIVDRLLTTAPAQSAIETLNHFGTQRDQGKIQRPRSHYKPLIISHAPLMWLLAPTVPLQAFPTCSVCLDCLLRYRDIVVVNLQYLVLQR